MEENNDESTNGSGGLDISTIVVIFDRTLFS
jgi:hypothetical protein